MGAKTKKTKSFGRYGSGYGVRVKKELNEIESQQRKRQPSPFRPKGRAKRIAAGIWKDVKTGKIFAGHAYYLTNKNQ